MSSRLPLLVALATVACTGGGGALAQSIGTQDDAPISNEGVSNSTEGYSSSLERVGNSTESARGSAESSPTGGGFNCSGTYNCSLNGKASNDPVILVSSGDGCLVLDDDGDGATLQSDGTIMQKGQVIANWSATGGGGFTYSASSTSSKGQTTTITISCNKVSSDTTPAPKKDDSDPPRAGADAG